MKIRYLSQIALALALGLFAACQAPGTPSPGASASPAASASPSTPSGTLTAETATDARLQQGVSCLKAKNHPLAGQTELAVNAYMSSKGNPSLAPANQTYLSVAISGITQGGC
ncbi:MAG TPA: hypothetical protein V6D23_28735 [Candidatus Obscuribacterales bacterium]